MTVIRDERAAIDIARDLQTAICSTDGKRETDNHALYHENSGSLEVKEPIMPDAMKKEDTPLYSEEEIFAMARNIRREQSAG